MCWVTNLTMDCLEKEKTQRNIYCVSNSNGAVKIQWAHHLLFLVLFCSNKLHLVQYFHSKSLYWILGPNFWLAAGPSINKIWMSLKLHATWQIWMIWMTNFQQLDQRWMRKYFPHPVSQVDLYVCLIEGKHVTYIVCRHIIYIKRPLWVHILCTGPSDTFLGESRTPYVEMR